MKPFFISLIFLVSYTSVLADIHNLTFIVGDNTYLTGSCTIGAEVLLPTPPEKYGYDFNGWQPVFYRGTFATWNYIPTEANGYNADPNGTYIPKENDYIIIENASDVPKINDKFEIEVSTQRYASVWTDYCRTFIDGVNYGCNNIVSKNLLIIKSGVNFNGNYSTTWQSDTNDILFKKSIQSVGSTIALSVNTKNNGTHIGYFVDGFPYSGKWLLRYRGVWERDNRSGWYAVKQMD